MNEEDIYMYNGILFKHEKEGYLVNLQQHGCTLISLYHTEKDKYSLVFLK